MFTKKITISVLTCLLFTVKSYAGFGLETTRLVYHEKNNSEGVVAFNTDKNRNYLLQSWVEDKAGKVSPDFVSTPPLLKLRAEQKNTLQVTKVVNLPSDRESLYWLNVKFVAPSSEGKENVLRYSMTNRIKIIYRPESLDNKDIETYVDKLTWSVSGNTLTVKNPTPYYVNVSKLVINNQEIKLSDGYLTPKSEETLKLSGTTNAPAHIRLTYINDYGKAIEKNVSVK
ncbi:molecular chaperone [Morganella psychrotolerans]|uniref:Molecular chaperone n=1 Tax=Morganella psychrotolerans TaxID=368603 RepID=A0A5M9R2W0_9GAMM|nr:molecular chaperone [Morganella psychrotolerans]KAA8714216.1 molecular chaperone [Morganella psychrotolerans]